MGSIFPTCERIVPIYTCANPYTPAIPQPNVTTQDVILTSLNLSGIVSRGFQTAPASMFQDGLDRLNGFIALRSVDFRMIPYYETFTGYLYQGVERYFIPNLVAIDTFTFFLNNVRYNMSEYTRTDYFGQARVENVDSLPYIWHMERCYGGSNLWVYFLPLDNYRFEIAGKFQLQQVYLNQNLSFVYDQFYLEYLKYGLADYMCGLYQIPTPDHVLKTLKEMKYSVGDTSPLDFTLTKRTAFNEQPAINFTEAALSPGWRPF